MSKIIGEITVSIDGEEKTFKVRRLKHSQQMRLTALLRMSASEFKTDDAGNLLAANLDPEKLGAYQNELCALRLCDDEGKAIFTADEIDELGSIDVRAITSALDKLIGPAKTSVEHSGNS